MDVTLNQEQFDYLLDSIKSLDLSYNETEAYYADGYQEIIFANRTTDDGENPDYIVSMAEIKKVVYNTETLNIVFVDFTIYDAYPLYEIAYFNRFGIEWSSYIEYME